MNAEAFAEWLRRQGHHVVRTASCYWYDAGPRVYQAFPYHWVIDPFAEELADIFRRNRAIALRYSTSLGKPPGQISYHVIYDKTSYPLASLSQDARRNVRKGLGHASYEPISMSSLASEGWKLHSETLVRQGRQQAETKEAWERMCLCAEGLPGFEAWGAIHEGALVAALLAHTVDDTVSVLYHQSRTCHLKYGVNNGLTYSFTQTALQRPGIRCVFYGLHSLDAPPGVDEFKFRMEYLAKPVRQRVVFSPLVRPFINRLSYGSLRICLNLWPGSPTVAKAEGMVRFYLQGKHPLYDQVWPEALRQQKEATLNEVREQGEKASQEN
jgi:hypothetical protein